jgi:Ser/Thr protein kinase RdoA (MazF antagonist)
MTVSDRLAWGRSVAEAALIEYGLGPECELSTLGVSENVLFRVDDRVGGRRSVLRVHRPGYHSVAAIRSELAWLRALRRDRVADVPEVIPGPDGAEVVSVPGTDGDAAHVVRFRWLDGQEPVGTRLTEDFHTLGRIAARFHRHARTWDPPPGFTRPRWDWDTSIGERGHWGRWQDGPGVGRGERVLLGRTAEKVRERLVGFGTGPDRFGLVHADMRLANLLVDPTDGRVRVIDFDDCGFSWFLYDFAAAVSFLEDDPRVPEWARAWVRGYRSQAPLPVEQERELPTFVILRRLLLLAWLGTHPDTEPARELGGRFAEVTCALAEEYLSRGAPHPGW